MNKRIVIGFKKLLGGKTDEAVEKIRIVGRSDEVENRIKILVRIVVFNAKTGKKVMNLFYLSDAEITKLKEWFASKDMHVREGIVKEVQITIE
ncbi:MAG: hypothetical protein ACOX6Q_01795 [Candidatus Dojkabacteria bacterium]|jgi:hypothetical protein